MSVPDDSPRQPRERHLEPGERDPEASPEDVAEQVTPADPAEDEPEVHIDNEVSEWDAVEQSRVVHLDDDYR